MCHILKCPPEAPRCPRNPYVGRVQHKDTFMNATAEFPRLTATEEAELILQDVFGEDEDDIKLSVLEALCSEEGIPFKWQKKGNDMELANWDLIVEAIIEREDDLYTMAEQYKAMF